MALAQIKSFVVPFKDKILNPDGTMNQPWEWFFRNIWERLNPLGLEKTTPITNNINAKTFAASDVNTTTDAITETGHGYYTGLPGKLTTTGALPGGLNGTLTYYVIKVDDDTYKLALNPTNAQAGTAINITSQGSGNHTFTPWVDVEGLSFNSKELSSAVVEYLIQRVTTGVGASELIESGIFIVSYRPTSQNWSLHSVSANSPSDSGIDFTISAEGQVRYTSSNVTGAPSISRMFYRVRSLGGKNHQYSSLAAGGR